MKLLSSTDRQHPVRPHRARQGFRTNAALTLTLLMFAAICNACSQADERAAQEYAKAVERFNAYDLDGAQRALKIVLEADPDSAPAHVMQGKIYFYRQNYEDAGVSFQRAANSNPDHIDAMFWQARTRMMKNEDEADEQALQMLDRIISLDSAHIEAWYAKGLLHQKRGQMDAAIAAYKSGLQNSGKIALIYLQLGSVYHKANLPGEAERYFERALALSADPDLRAYVEAIRDDARTPSVGPEAAPR